MLEIRWQPTPKELRVFSALLIPFGALVAALMFRRVGNPSLSWAIVGTSSLIGTIGCLWPALVRPVYVGWMIAVFPIGWTVSHLVLAAIFYLVFTPIGCLLRWSGRDSMQRRWDRNATTYWETRRAVRPPADYFRQF